MALPVPRQEGCQQRRNHLRRCGDLQSARLSFRQSAGVLGQHVGVREQLPAALQQVLAFRCQPQGAPDMFEQRHAKLGLERIELA